MSRQKATDSVCKKLASFERKWRICLTLMKSRLQPAEATIEPFSSSEIAHVELIKTHLGCALRIYHF